MMPKAAVDFPQPDSPTSPYDSPRPIVNETPGARAVDPADAVDELEVADLERRRPSSDRAHRSYTSGSPSATRFTATTRLAIASAGNSVVHQYGSMSGQYW